MQAFRRKDISQLKVYEGSGTLMNHSENLPASLLSVLGEGQEEGERRAPISCGHGQFNPLS